METKESKRIKILYVITKSNWGGAQRYVYDMATGLSKERYDVSVAFGSAGMLKERLDDASIRTLLIPSLGRDVNPIKDLKSLFSLIALFRREKPDVIHLNSSKIGGLGAVAGKLAGVKRIIFTGHGWAFNEDRNMISKALILALHWIMIVLTDQTIAVCLEIKSQMSRLPLVSGKMVVIHNGIDGSRSEARMLSRTEARNALGLAADATEMGTISELHANKGLDFLIRAAAELKALPDAPRFHITIIGEGQERERLTRLIEEKKLGDTVTLKGYLSDASTYAKAFDIFTLTSRTEALPYTLLEAGLACLPVLSSAVGGIPEIIDQMHSGILVKSGNIKEIRDGLLFLLNEPERRAFFGAELRSHVEGSFTLAQMIKETEDVYMKTYSSPKNSLPMASL